jgi:hypothetical protein
LKWWWPPFCVVLVRPPSPAVVAALLVAAAASWVGGLLRSLWAGADFFAVFSYCYCLGWALVGCVQCYVVWGDFWGYWGCVVVQFEEVWG